MGKLLLVSCWVGCGASVTETKQAESCGWSRQSILAYLDNADGYLGMVTERREPHEVALFEDSEDEIAALNRIQHEDSLAIKAAWRSRSELIQPTRAAIDSARLAWLEGSNPIPATAALMVRLRMFELLEVGYWRRLKVSQTEARRVLAKVQGKTPRTMRQRQSNRKLIELAEDQLAVGRMALDMGTLDRRQLASLESAMTSYWNSCP